jgi:hypothetical protein
MVADKMLQKCDTGMPRQSGSRKKALKVRQAEHKPA